MKTNHSIAHAYGGFQLEIMGTIDLKFVCRSREAEETFSVVNDRGTSKLEPLLSRNMCEKLRLITRIELTSMTYNHCHNSPKKLNFQNKQAIIGQYSEIFEGIGEFPDTYNLKLSNDAKPRSDHTHEYH